MRNSNNDVSMLPMMGMLSVATPFLIIVLGMGIIDGFRLTPLTETEIWQRRCMMEPQICSIAKTEIERIRNERAN